MLLAIAVGKQRSAVSLHDVENSILILPRAEATGILE
jgi:hypothetical protein